MIDRIPKTLALAVGLIALTLLANLYGPAPTINHYHDVNVYHDRGMWAHGGGAAYRDVFSEYPQIATWAFGIPHVVIDTFYDGQDQTRHRRLYRFFFSAMMAACLAVMIMLLSKCGSSHPLLPWVLLLPAALFYTHNRFDVLPALLTVISLYLLKMRRWYLACAVLAVAVATKWYPLVMLPAFLSHIRSKRRDAVWRCVVVFGSVGVLICAVTIVEIGWEGFLIPYRFHLGRDGNREGLYFLLTRGLGIGESATVKWGFLLMQFAIAPLAWLRSCREWRDAVLFSAASVIGFVLFAKYYSPQWLLWISPLLVLIVRGRLWVISIIAFDLITFAYYPILYFDDRFHSLKWPMVIGLKTLILVMWLAALVAAGVKGTESANQR